MEYLELRLPPKSPFLPILILSCQANFFVALIIFYWTWRVLLGIHHLPYYRKSLHEATTTCSSRIVHSQKSMNSGGVIHPKSDHWSICSLHIKNIIDAQNWTKYLSKLVYITLSHRFTDLSCECKNVVQTCPELTLFLPLWQFFWHHEWTSLSPASHLPR